METRGVGRADLCWPTARGVRQARETASRRGRDATPLDTIFYCCRHKKIRYDNVKIILKSEFVKLIVGTMTTSKQIKCVRTGTARNSSDSRRRGANARSLRQRQCLTPCVRRCVPVFGP